MDQKLFTHLVFYISITVLFAFTLEVFPQPASYSFCICTQQHKFHLPPVVLIVHTEHAHVPLNRPWKYN